MVVDDQAPLVTLSLDREVVSLEELIMNPLMISFIATDRVAISGWSLLVYSEEGQLVRLLGTSSSSDMTVQRDESWGGIDRFGIPVERGRYKIFFAATDAAGNQSNTEQWVSVE